LAFQEHMGMIINILQVSIDKGKLTINRSNHLSRRVMHES
jgi:hypothetical protein